MTGGKNKEGYPDPTAAAAIGHMAKEEQFQLSKDRTEEEKTLHRAIHVMRSVATAFDFEIVGRITLRDKETGKVYR